MFHSDINTANTYIFVHGYVHEYKTTDFRKFSELIANTEKNSIKSRLCVGLHSFQTCCTCKETCHFLEKEKKKSYQKKLFAS